MSRLTEVLDRLAATIEERSRNYLARHGESGMAVGAVLFDRGRRIRAAGPVGGPLRRGHRAEAQLGGYPGAQRDAGQLHADSRRT